MSKKAIKQSLFRFVTLRNPQLIEEKDKDQGFVYHPDETKSSFYEASNASETEKQAALRDVTSTFSALKNRKEVKDATKDLYQFSSWLMRNKKTLSYAEIKLNSLNVEVLTMEQELLVWDNLIYQTIEKTSVYAREALIQVLIANKFLTAFLRFSEELEEDILFTEDQEKEFVRRACANVVVSKTLFSSTIIKEDAKIRKANPIVAKQLEDFTEVSVAKTEIEKLNALKEALKPVELSNSKSVQTAYNSALESHNEEVDRLIKAAEPVILEETNPETGKITKTETYPNLELPKFNFRPSSPIYNSYMKAKLSEDNYKSFEKADLEMYDSFEQVYGSINEKVKKLNSIVFSKTEKPIKKIQVGGATISNRVPTQDMANYVICIIGDAIVSDAVMSFNIIGNDDTPVSIDCNATLSNGTVLNTSDLDVMNNTGSFITIRMLDNAELTGNAWVRFTGTLTFDSGVTYGFDSTVSLRSAKARGVFSLEDVTDPNDNPNDNPSSDPILPQRFGVTNLGIADFRRVEQDVCCYVPGEVSHIENILAREYKERSTRSLTSVETTSETTTEKEVENLSDTTTTERNEMQSEVSSVLNEDESQNYGASAYVKGSYGKSLEFGADAHADFSSSSSSSNANSQAQTYAQEVTDRAMERIVQKISTKRTSRILREFEENNKHGFDNTKGDKHVTGIFRWVDKIYKNKLINYGKRLTYEFAIPEPARFLKDALIKKDDEGQLDTGIVMPTEPETPLSIGLSSAASINEGTYQGFASKYGAQVNAPVDQYIKIGKAFTKEDQSYNSNGYAFNEIDIPEGYHATFGTVNWSVVSQVTSNRRLSIALGDYRQTVIGGTGSSYFYNFSDMYKKNIPFSFHAWYIHSGHFSVTVNCERSTETFKQWQNETYNAIMDAYNERLREYNEAIIANNVIPTNDGEKLKFNPLFNRSLEKKELKRIAIELLIEQNKVSKNNYEGDALVGVVKDEAFQTHASTVKFFEQAFDWDIMAYVLYPYFYANQNDWKDLFQETDAADPLFQAFLQSGMARTVVPVRPGFEDAVNWYMSTGEIWNGQGLVTDQDDDLYISVAEEMQTIEGEVEGTWETRVPTALTIVQADSALLDEAGLPCFCEDEALDNPIQPSSDLIGGERGVGSDEVGATNTVV